MAKQYNRYAAGRKVYGGGRSNPTSGTVDPTGYIERSANNMASERRSGLASSAISRRLDKRSAPIGGGIAPAPVAAPAPSPTGQNYSLPQPTALNTRKGPGAPINRAVNRAAIMNEDKAAWQQEQDTINNWEPPIDPYAEAEEAEAEAVRGRFLAELDKQETDFRGASARRLSQLQEQLPIATGQITDDFASRGMGYSGRHALERGNIERDFASRITREGEDFTSRMSEIAAARGGKNSEIEVMINRIRSEAAARNAENPAFRAPVATRTNPFAPYTGGGGVVNQDESALDAIKRRLAGPWKRL